ncbi:AAA family ATPase [Roseateles sp. BYS87W]|uniref:AAA family ATPase n=1 Tax=Pelomonas baiyunensis TaxID=3299026 RepID=A0ABW7H3P3_9BURK
MSSPTPPLILLSGSLGSGKTTVARLLAEQLPDGVHLESDLVYTFFRHPVPPHLPQAQRQNEAAIAAACQAALALLRRGYPVVLEGVLGPWVLPLVQAELAGWAGPVHYVILRTTHDEALRRVRARSGPGLDAVVAAMHPQFEALGSWERHVVDTTALTAEAVVGRVLGGILGRDWVWRLRDALPAAVEGVP